SFLTGLHLADVSVISCAMSPTVFNIPKHVENGVVVESLYDQTSWMIRYFTESPPFKIKLFSCSTTKTL
ncbi:hypothetical protein EV421DRAFT_1722759, partial [Armillaria borealis]